MDASGGLCLSSSQILVQFLSRLLHVARTSHCHQPPVGTGFLDSVCLLWCTGACSTEECGGSILFITEDRKEVLQSNGWTLATLSKMVEGFQSPRMTLSYQVMCTQCIHVNSHVHINMPGVEYAVQLQYHTSWPLDTSLF